MVFSSIEWSFLVAYLTTLFFSSISAPLAYFSLGNQPAYPYCHAPAPFAEAYEPLKTPDGEATLQQVHLFIRHGDRTPIRFIPRNHLEANVVWNCPEPHQDLSLIDDFDGQGTLTYHKVKVPHSNPYFPFANTVWNGSCDLGQLTNRGAVQQQLLGQALRYLYVKKLSFLPEKMDNSLLHVRSSNYWRTKESVKNLFSTLYPASQRSENQHLTMVTYPTIVENLYPRDDCYSQQNDRVEIEQSDIFQQAISNMSQFLDKAELIFGTQKSPRDIKNLNNYFDTIQARLCHGIPLPSYDGVSFSESDIQAIQDFSNFESSYLFRTGGKTAVRYQSVGVSNLMNEIFAYLRNPSSSKKFYVYSGHDSTLSLLLGALNAKDMSWPPYASNMMIELWKGKNDYFVRVVYNGKTLDTADGWCDFEQCTLEAFETYFEPTLNIDLNSVCQP